MSTPRRGHDPLSRELANSAHQRLDQLAATTGNLGQRLHELEEAAVAPSLGVSELVNRLAARLEAVEQEGERQVEEIRDAFVRDRERMTATEAALFSLTERLNDAVNDDRRRPGARAFRLDQQEAKLGEVIVLLSELSTMTSAAVRKLDERLRELAESVDRLDRLVSGLLLPREERLR